MESTNPYQAPGADLAQTPGMDQFDESSVFSISGRFGRLSYLAWSLIITVVMWLVMMVMSIVAGTAMGAGSAETGAIVVGLLSFVVVIAGAYFGVVFAGRRLHDINASAWWVLLMLVPIVSFIFILVLWFAPGNEGENRFAGVRITPGWEKVVGWLFPIAIIGFSILMTAVAIPAYEEYLSRAMGG